VPVLGVYHTDFPAYVDHLFEDHGFTWATKRFMQWFYNPFSAVFTRSNDYIDSLEALGLDREKCLSLRPGVDTELFDARFADADHYPVLGREREVSDNRASRETGEVLYVGRVSVEKNRPVLVKVWKDTDKRCEEQGLAAGLVVGGDGPDRH